MSAAITACSEGERAPVLINERPNNPHAEAFSCRRIEVGGKTGTVILNLDSNTSAAWNDPNFDARRTVFGSVGDEFVSDQTNRHNELGRDWRRLTQRCDRTRRYDIREVGQQPLGISEGTGRLAGVLYVEVAVYSGNCVHSRRR